MKPPKPATPPPSLCPRCKAEFNSRECGCDPCRNRFMDCHCVQVVRRAGVLGVAVARCPGCVARGCSSKVARCRGETGRVA